MKQDCDCSEICSGGADAAVASSKAGRASLARVLLFLGGPFAFCPCSAACLQASWSLGRKGCEGVPASLLVSGCSLGLNYNTQFCFGRSWAVFTRLPVSSSPAGAFWRAAVPCCWELSPAGQSQICSLSRRASQRPLKLATV